MFFFFRSYSLYAVFVTNQTIYGCLLYLFVLVNHLALILIIDLLSLLFKKNFTLDLQLLRFLSQG